MNHIKKLYNWMGQKTYSKNATAWLSALFFVEAIFFLPVDPILMLFCINRPNKSLFYAAIATVSSVAGGVAGYLIGYFLWSSLGLKLVTWIISESVFWGAVKKYELYQNLTVLIAGFTPLPYKAITLSAGFCRLPLIPFISYSLISRGARFFLVAGLLRFYGERIKGFIDQYFNLLVVSFVMIVIASCYLFNFL